MRDSDIDLNGNRECKENVKTNANIYRSRTEDQGVMFNTVNCNQQT
jgi:hypothetical protein